MEYSQGIVIHRSGTDFPDCFLLNIQTKEVTAYKSLEWAKRRLETLPATIPFCSRCGDVEDQSFLMEQGSPFRFTIRGFLGKPILAAIR